MHRECLERFPRHRLQKKSLISDPGMHHGTCVTHVTLWMSGSPTRSGGENVPGIPGACASRNIAYLLRSPWAWFMVYNDFGMILPLYLLLEYCIRHDAIGILQSNHILNYVNLQGIFRFYYRLSWWFWFRVLIFFVLYVGPLFVINDIWLVSLT